MQATSIEHELGGHTSKQQLYYASTQGFTCFLQSSYEITVATSLDKHFVKWTRPKPLKWLDSNNISHRYYPDFYLADYDIYLDPKNDYLIANDIVKINAVMSQNNVKILVLTKHELSWSIIKGLCL